MLMLKTPPKDAITGNPDGGITLTLLHVPYSQQRSFHDQKIVATHLDRWFKSSRILQVLQNKGLRGSVA